jgi:uncharacterized protein (TIGR02284 family)
VSDDAKAAKELVETLKDGEKGYATAADKLRDGDRPEWATTMQRFSEQRAGFWREIVEMGHEYGDDVDESGTVAAALHRGWLSLKDAVTGDDPDAVLKAAETGEDHAVKEYEDALEMDLSVGFREVVVRQQADVLAARDELKALKNAS